MMVLIWVYVSIVKKKSYKTDSTHGTSNLHDHLKRCAKRPNQVIRQMLLRDTSKKDDGKQELHNHIFYQQLSRNELPIAIILHEYPLSIVNHIGF